MMLIGIAGKRGAGKDTLAGFLRAKYGFLNLPFAEELKQQVRDEFGLTREHTDGKLKEAPLDLIRGYHALNPHCPVFWTPREIMIQYGQFFRQFDENWWVKRVFDKIQQIRVLKSYGESMRVSISDVRFENEADYIKEQGGLLVRLERKPELNIYKGVCNDVSETDLDDYESFDYRLDADHNIDLSDLEKFADTIMANEALKR